MAIHYPPLGPLRRTVREVGLGLITLGVIILAFVAYQLFGTNFTEEHNQAALQHTFDLSLQSHASSPVVGPTSATVDPTIPPAGKALDHLVIPKIGVDKFVVQGVGEQDLTQGPGHYPQTVLPGEQGNAAIAGHRTTYGAPFFRLNELGVGDDIYITDTAGQKFLYKVSEPAKVVAPTDVAVLDPTPDAQLTLTTCNPRFSATSRLIIVAKLSGQPALPATFQANLATRANSSLTAGNPTAWPGALLYGAVVVAGWVLVRLAINRTRRWRRAGAYLFGIGLCAIPLWFCFENVVRLLPASI